MDELEVHGYPIVLIRSVFFLGNSFFQKKHSQEYLQKYKYKRIAVKLFFSTLERWFN